MFVLAPKLRLGRFIPEALLPRNRRWLTERLDEAELRKRPYRSRAEVREGVVFCGDTSGSVPDHSQSIALTPTAGATTSLRAGVMTTRISFDFEGSAFGALRLTPCGLAREMRIAAAVQGYVQGIVSGARQRSSPT
jgi:hypothetical protein